jgi:hypothetical protein
MTDPVESMKVFTWKGLLPSLLNQEEQVGSIDGDLTVEHSRLKLTPHDVRNIKWFRYLKPPLLTKEQHIH